MRNKFLAILILMFWALPCFAKHLHSEKEYQAYWCNKRGGQMEYKLNDGTRIDCLLPDMAVEFDFAPKWSECIGQAVHYGTKTKRTPACVLIIENRQKDVKYLKRLRYDAYTKRHLTNFRTFTIKPEVFSECSNADTVSGVCAI